MREVKDETALPFNRDHPSRSRFDWARSKTDPTVLIDCMTGDCYRRRDGAYWEHPAYKVTKNRAGEWEPIESNTAPEDHTVYPPTSTKRSAA
jgi:hypothetical protein